jgi:hypothetical protein
MNTALAAQLMIGKDELAAFGETGIAACLERAAEILDLGWLFLAVEDPSSAPARHAIAACRARGARTALWTMVLADAPGPAPAEVQDARGRTGYGRLGTWDGMGRGQEKFLFACPTCALEDGDGPARAVRALQDAGADAVFLDRIRYPSPAGGLELLGACGCTACGSRYRTATGEDWPDLAAWALELAGQGGRGAERFLERSAPALAFRAGTIAAVVARFAAAARRAGGQVGLDLFAPALATLVGQDYALLAPHADFVKAMLYCKARGPAGLPLELSCLTDGLVQGGVAREAAREFAAGLTELPLAEIAAAAGPEGLPAERAGAEHARALRWMARAGRAAPPLHAGIELVDHPAYSTRIDAGARDRYLAALRGAPVVVSWNLLYVPAEHLAAVRAAASVPPGAAGAP